MSNSSSGNVGIVIVSHSSKIAEGAADMVRQMVGNAVPLAWTGGDTDGGLGTNVAGILEAIEAAWSPAGVAILVDLGGAETNSEMAVEMLAEDRRARVVVCNAPVVEGNFIFGNSEGTLRCLGWSDGEVRWSAKKGEFELGTGGSIVKSGDKLILFGERGTLSLARTTDKGAQKLARMKLFDGDQNWSTPLLYRGRLYAKSASELVALDLPAVAPAAAK